MSSFTFTFAAESVTLAAGQYRKVSIAGIDGKKTNKTGTAFLTVTEDGAAFYTNRRGEIEDKLTHKRVLVILRTGINTLMVATETVEEPTMGVAVEATPLAELSGLDIDALRAELDAVDVTGWNMIEGGAETMSQALVQLVASAPNATHVPTDDGFRLLGNSLNYTCAAPIAATTPPVRKRKATVNA